MDVLIMGFLSRRHEFSSELHARGVKFPRGKGPQLDIFQIFCEGNWSRSDQTFKKSENGIISFSALVWILSTFLLGPNMNELAKVFWIIVRAWPIEEILLDDFSLSIFRHFQIRIDNRMVFFLTSGKWRIFPHEKIFLLRGLPNGKKDS